MLSSDTARYARHFSLPEVGAEGQARLAQARVLLVGAGGLGSPVALYLAAAGIGTLGLIDPDTVALSNLQRQILYSSAEVGQPKVAKAAARLSALNPEIEILTWQTALSPANAESLIRDFDVIVDGSDRLALRYLLSDACSLLGKPLVHGAVYRFEGQVATFLPTGPCYRCLHPTPPPPGAVPACSEAGVLGVLPGLVGTLQASEVLRLLLGWSEGLSGRLLLADLRDMGFQTLSLPRDPACRRCGPAPEIQGIDPAEYPELEDVASLDLEAARAQGDRLIWLDVRTAAERACGHLGGRHLPLDQLESQWQTLNPKLPLLVYCQKGPRARQAARFLQKQGFQQVWVLAGGYQQGASSP
ncbi:MAG: molybdopterin-synthase adenylyltransferase MoeB [Candidatus Sericytochromatia bacterium]